MALPNSSFFQESGAPISLRRMIANANWSEAVEDGNKTRKSSTYTQAADVSSKGIDG